MPIRRTAFEFHETQQIRQWWIWLVVIILDIYFFIGFLYRAFLHLTYFDNRFDQDFYGIGTLILIIINTLMYVSKMELSITPRGVALRFYPFRTEWQVFPWELIRHIRIRRFSAIREFSGWGVRLKSVGHGIAYLFGGCRALELILRNDATVLISTQRPMEMMQFLRAIFAKYLMSDMHK
ncbi:MAG: hypothetical protein K1X68_05675 [Saprospiraceae bacterium]|nr:hypothetical protein [Saprospiraceae bacterium]HMW40150.1 hypothetical protein [Saprospiraceae bacterium]HMX88956.1 hypothetical protein [Saprospiraceae bacterium]HMZ40163.1 hypothetical protein [Saprospiraceae bacterium]HNA64905.1 hypothetical protein [Saprospiraceae bacterium]